ncbi:unnamed protein product, partial [Iphiclides podalirius]
MPPREPPMFTSAFSFQSANYVFVPNNETRYACVSTKRIAAASATTCETALTRYSTKRRSDYVTLRAPIPFLEARSLDVGSARSVTFALG